MNRGFASIHPAPCFLYYMGLIVLVTLVNHPLFLLMALFSQITLNILQDGGKRLNKSLKYYIFFGLTIFIINPFISHRGSTIILHFLDNPITLEAMVFGFSMMLSLLTVLITFTSYNMVITPDKFMFLFSSILPKTAFMTMMSMRFVPVLRKRSQDIALVQRAQGIKRASGNLIKRIKNTMLLLNILVTWSLEEAIITAKSVRGRGYGITKNRSHYFDYKIMKYDVVIFFTMFCTGVSLFYMWHKDVGQFQIYPKVGQPTFDIHTCIFLIISFIHFCIPIVIEGAEKLRWI